MVRFKENSRKESACKFLEEIRERNTEGSILMILDNFAQGKDGLGECYGAGHMLSILTALLTRPEPDLAYLVSSGKAISKHISTPSLAATLL